ncbi:subunit of efflux pump conferring antibiotic resistance [compost metagenome]
MVGVLLVLLDWLVPGLPLSLSPPLVMLALLLSALVGISAGLAPARRAARLRPVDALRL